MHDPELSSSPAHLEAPKTRRNRAQGLLRFLTATVILGAATSSSWGCDDESSDLEARLQAALQRRGVAGASAALFRDGRFETAAVGLANVATQTPMTEDTVMHIGSITKVLNATLVMQLVDEGLIELEAPLIDYVEDFAVQDPLATRAITVEMLINHTSGIDGEILPDHGPDRERIVDAVQRSREMPQIHAPGEDVSYCNIATVLAGYLAQEVTGESWYTLMKERIFEPLEMSHSVVLPQDALLHRASVGHYATAKGLVRTSQAFLPLSFAPAGATAMLSAKDLATFGVAHLQDGMGLNGFRILEEESALAMRTKTATSQGVSTEHVGLGWMLTEEGLAHHGGGGPGIVSWLYVAPEHDVVLAVLTNSAHGMGVIQEIAAPLLRELGLTDFSARAIEVASTAKKRPIDPAPFLGRYGNISLEMDIVALGEGLGLRYRSKVVSYVDIHQDSSFSWSSPTPLLPCGDGRFLATGGAVSGVLSFVNPDENGQTQHVEMSARLYRRTTQ